ncbi:sequestosome-1 [Anaeramoeba flamelloides]|uniref:Sequestosome-1 n=1 Tax=Anaeramoeba flamelloides TaxID=1746091 RepID=A0AAV7ZAK8_9EUKA|nr:sequestosome-1 [Anaeramoeba flamelloides]
MTNLQSTQDFVTVKINYNQQVRRIRAKSNISLVEIYQYLDKLFSPDQITNSNHYLKYVDDEGDMITLTSELELQEALSLVKTLKPPYLRLYLEKYYLEKEKDIDTEKEKETKKEKEKEKEIETEQQKVGEKSNKDKKEFDEQNQDFFQTYEFKENENTEKESIYPDLKTEMNTTQNNGETNTQEFLQSENLLLDFGSNKNDQSEDSLKNNFFDQNSEEKELEKLIQQQSDQSVDFVDYNEIEIVKKKSTNENENKKKTKVKKKKLNLKKKKNKTTKTNTKEEKKTLTNIYKKIGRPTKGKNPEEIYSQQLQQLDSMGFKDLEKNIKAIKKYKGNVPKVVQYYCKK